ncbi:MAG: hypothetical protein ACO3SO_12690, partial [Luteolibacter sp.]
RHFTRLFAHQSGRLLPYDGEQNGANGQSIITHKLLLLRDFPRNPWGFLDLGSSDSLSARIMA